MSSAPFRSAWLAVAASVFVALAAIGPAAAEQISGKRVALVVGNSRYARVTRLVNPGNDARLIAQTLSKAGFVLVGGGVQLDLTKARFDQDIAAFGRAADGAAVSYVGPAAAEMPEWQVSEILMKGQAAAPAEEKMQAAAPAVVPAARPLAAPEAQQVAARPGSAQGFHCPLHDTEASVNGHVVAWVGVAPGSAHMCVSKIDGRFQYRLFGFYTVGGGDVRAVDDALSGFFLGTADEATVVINGQRYTWHHVGTDRVTNHGAAVEVAVLRVDTAEDGSFGGGRHRGTWTILYDAHDGLLLRGTYVNDAGERHLEPDDWETATFYAAGS